VLRERAQQLLTSRITGQVLLSEFHMSGKRFLAGHAEFAESGVPVSYFGAGAGWFSLVGGTIPFSRK